MKKWTAWIDYNDKVVTDEIEFRETSKMFIVADDTRHPAIGYSARISKADSRIHDTREAAIEYAIDREKAILEDCQRKVNKANGRITLLRKAASNG